MTGGPQEAPERVTALVVDDDEDIREVARLALEVFAGWRVHTADGGEQALALLGRTGVDVVLMDVMMPELDGLATIRRMQADPRTADVPVVLLTAKLQVGTRQAWDGHDVRGVIPKPFSVQSLGEQVVHILGWSPEVLLSRR